MHSAHSQAGLILLPLSQAPPTPLACLPASVPSVHINLIAAYRKYNMIITLEMQMMMNICNDILELKIQSSFSFMSLTHEYGELFRWGEVGKITQLTILIPTLVSHSGSHSLTHPPKIRKVEP